MAEPSAARSSTFTSQAAFKALLTLDQFYDILEDFTTNLSIAFLLV